MSFWVIHAGTYLFALEEGLEQGGDLGGGVGGGGAEGRTAREGHTLG